MKKRILDNGLQYIGALALLALTVAFIFAFRAGSLPFMDSDYLEARAEAESVSKPDSSKGEDVAPQAPVEETATSYIVGLVKADKATTPYKGVYAAGCDIQLRSLSGLNLSGGESLEVVMGFAVVKDGGKVTAVYDNRLDNVTSLINGYSFTFNRDISGNPLFYGADGYSYLQNGSMVSSKYDKYNQDKGLYCEYPSYEAGYNTDYDVFEENGLFGLRKASDGSVIIPASYVDVYGVSEGYCIAVDSDMRLYLYSSEGKLITKDYYSTDDDSAAATGYFFVRNGLTRVRSADGRELVLRANGSLLKLPSGFELVAYSDGVLLLKGEGGYGYMHHSGRWLTTPDYKNALPFNEGLAVVYNANGLCGMIDLNGETVVPFVFDKIASSSDGVILAYTKKFGYYLLNKVA